MPSKTFLFLSILNLILYLTKTSSFNIDTEYLIVKTGPPDSFFGYQVTFHIDKTRSTLIVVGAPRDNISHYQAKPFSGNLYHCKYESSETCEEFNLNRITSDTNDGMWLGGALRSRAEIDGGKIVACAHRFMNKEWGEGACIVFENNLAYEMMALPCGGDLPKKNGHSEFGLCQAGISADITEDKDLLIGIPGPYIWRGAVSVRSVSDDLFISDYEYMSEVEQDKNPPTKSYSYLGWSTGSGKVLPDSSRLAYISGAPRSLEIGQVFFFTKDLTIEKMVAQESLTGEQFGSSFGFSLAVLDFNNDGLDDLVVGAPFYRDGWMSGAVYVYTNQPGKGINSYIKPHKLTPKALSKSECLKVSCLNSQFGHTLANIGDIDQDGYQDLAVGAPYEDMGVVYIYKGGAKGLKLSQVIKPQKFKAFGISIHGEGVDIDENGYPDMVVGAYQSHQAVVLRGRPIIDVKHTLQALPSTIDPADTSCPHNNHPSNCLNLRFCFKLLPSRVKGKSNPRVTLPYSIEADFSKHDDITRVFFVTTGKSKLIGEADVASENVCDEKMLYFKSNVRDWLNAIPFRLNYSLKIDKPYNRGGVTPIDSYYLIDQSKAIDVIMVDFKKNCGDDDVCKSDLKLQASLDLPKNNDEIYRLRVGQDKVVVMRIEVVNTQEDAHDSILSFNLTDNIVFSGVDSEENEVVCDASGEPITCGLGNPLSGGGRVKFGIRLNTEKATSSKQSASIILLANTTSEEVEEKDNRLELKLEIKVETDLYMSGSSDPVSVFFSGKGEGASEVKEEEDIGPEVKHSYEIKNIGNATVAASKVSVWWPHELYSDHPHGKHLLYLLDPVLTEGGSVECKYDRRIINPLNVQVDYSKKLQTKDSLNLQIMKARLESKTKRHAKDENKEEEDEEDDNEGLRNKVKRYAKSSALSFGGFSSKELDCDKKTAKCVLIVCNLQELKTGHSVVLRFRSRLWSATMVQEFSKYDKIYINSKASIEIDPSLNIQQTSTENDSYKISTIVQPEFTTPRKVSWWIILLAVLIALLLLIGLIFLLWKCGFFKRSRGSSMASHKAEMLKKPYDED